MNGKHRTGLGVAVICSVHRADRDGVCRGPRASNGTKTVRVFTASS